MLAKTEHGPTKMKEIIDVLLGGGEKAVMDFCELSGGEWFDEAPEYFLTSYAAMSIKNVEKTYALLEVSVARTRKDAGAIRRGRVASDERMNGRFDVVLYWANGRPRGVVEVKSPIWFDSTAKCDPDFTRICKTINANCDSSFQFGIFLFYASVGKPQNTNIHDNSNTRIETLLEKIKVRAFKVAKDHNLDIHLERSPVHTGDDDEDGVWCVCAIAFTRKGGTSNLVNSNQ